MLVVNLAVPVTSNFALGAFVPMPTLPTVERQKSVVYDASEPVEPVHLMIEYPSAAVFPVYHETVLVLITIDPSLLI